MSLPSNCAFSATAVLGLAHHVDVGFCLKQHAQRTPQEFLIVDDKHTNATHSATASWDPMGTKIRRGRRILEPLGRARLQP